MTELELTEKEKILMMLQPIKRNDLYRRYNDEVVFARALIYIIENIPTKNKESD